MIWKTFDEWNAEGFRIHKGEKATKGRFAQWQVYPVNDDIADYDMDDFIPEHECF